ncbi:MAG: hypothetical protein IKQ29_03720 [Bacilli bacterium]|nr:hypothetical protein [Bacilli bacterium]
MTKYKINPGLACVMLVASFIAGGATLLTITALLFLFCEIDERIEQTATRIITFFIGISIVTMGWNLIVEGSGVVVDLIAKLFDTINNFLDYSDMINYQKFLTPIQAIINAADGVVSLLILLAKITYIIAILTNKPSKPNFVSKKIDEFVYQALTYLNNVNVGQMNPQSAPAAAGPAPAGVAPAPAPAPVPQPMQQAAPVQPTPVQAPPQPEQTPVQPQQPNM